MRYIDADVLRKNEIVRCHCVPCVGSNDNNYKDLDEVLNDCPTADVAPRSEVEWLEKENARLLNLSEYNRSAIEQDIADAKAELAREIFEEIEEHLRGIFDFFRQDNDIRESCAIMFALSEITKLKKKYTEDTP